jgi:hypothetical protein
LLRFDVDFHIADTKCQKIIKILTVWIPFYITDPT